MNIFGVDPGASGAIAFMRLGIIHTHKLDGTEQEAADFLKCWNDLDEGDSFAFIERVHSMPKQGVASSFKFGQSYGFLRGILTGLKIPFEEVTPQKWQKELGCLTKGDKNVSKQKAGQLFPDTKWTHATADAALICEYGRRVLAQRGAP